MAPDLSPADREFVRLIAREAAAEYYEISRRATAAAIAEHAAACPVMLKLQLSWWKLLCLLLASGTLGGGIAKLLPM